MAAVPSSPAVASIVISPDNHSPYVTITAALMLVIMMLFFFIRLAIRWPWNKLFAYDDATTVVATIIGICQSISVFDAVHYGLGRHVSKLDASRLLNTEKAIYAGDILFIFAICLAKLAVALLLLRLSSAKGQILATKILSGLIGAWGIVSVLAIGVRGRNLQPWTMTNRDNTSLANAWISTGCIGIAFDFAMLIFPLFLVWGLQMDTSSKITVIVGFALRLPASAITIVRLIAMKDAMTANDYTYDIVTTTCLMQIELHYTILSATIPCMRMFLKHFNTGYLGTTMEQLDPTASATALGSKGSNSYVMSTVRSRHLANNLSPIASANREDKHDELSLRPDGGNTITKARHEVRARTGSASMASEASDKIMISKTVQVDYDRGGEL